MTPFHISVPQADLDDLEGRLARARWPDEIPGIGWERGVPVGYLETLVDYWRAGYDWRAAEARLNGYPQYRVEIDGTPVHFLHVRSPDPDAVPLVLTHGWPGSVADFLDVIEPLSDPARHGGESSPAFHVVVPSVPGFGFSGPTRSRGWTVQRIAAAWAELMSLLGYERFVAQGGDAGSVISLELARHSPRRVRGVHVNLLPPTPPADPRELAMLNDSDRARLERMVTFDRELSGYLRLQSTRPQTLAYALTDSPVGQLAWIAEKFHEWADPTVRPGAGIDRDRLLTTVSIYWHTATAGSSAQLYYESADYLRRMLMESDDRPTPVSVPVGVAVFPHDFWLPVRQFADRDLPNIVHWSELDRGGHFPAMEEPDLLVADVRKFAGSLPLP